MKRLTTVPGRTPPSPPAPGALVRWYEPNTDWLFAAALFVLGLFVCFMMPGVGGLYLLAYLPVLAFRKLTAVLRVGLFEWMLFVAVAGNSTGLMARETDWSQPGGIYMFFLWQAQLLSVLILGLAWSQGDATWRDTSTLRRLLVTLTGMLPGSLLVVLAHQASQRRQAVEEGALMLCAAAVFYLVLQLKARSRRPWRDRKELLAFCRQRIRTRRQRKRQGRPAFPYVPEPVEDRVKRCLAGLPWSFWLALGFTSLLVLGMPVWLGVLLLIQGFLGLGLYALSKLDRRRIGDIREALLLYWPGNPLKKFWSRAARH